MFQKFGCTFSMILFLLFTGQGQTIVVVEGHVRFGETHEPVANYSVWVQSPVLENGDPIPLRTNEEGAYRLEMNATTGSSSSLDSVFLTIQVFDFCTGEIHSAIFELRPDMAWVFTYDVFVCQGIDPPPPPISCEAFFSYRQTGFDTLAVTFTDLSFSANTIRHYLWEFGDGEQSEEANPVHRYARAGVYPVSLMIESDSCVHHFTTEIYVSDRDDCICTTEYNPVCITDATGTQIRFSNACMARCAGYQPGDFVRCEDGGGDCICPDYYDPVCVAIGQDTISYANHCFAECEGFLPHQFIPCYPDSIGPCECITIYEPVCVVIDSVFVASFPNACEAVCAGFNDYQLLSCDPDYGCPAIYDPVCVFLPDGTIVEFTNACYAEQNGYQPHQWTSCDGQCICPAIYDPVCVRVGGGVIEFGNACEAECRGFTPDNFVDCNDYTCVCPDVFSPVCVVLPSGRVQSFNNACYAQCAGFDAGQFIDCTTHWACDCPLEFDPVCVVDDEGIIITLPNPCVAECRGYPADTWTNCEEQGCFASIEIKFDPNRPLTVMLSDASRSSEGAIVRYEWDLGDSTFAEGPEAEHTFPAPGIWAVTLKIETAEGCSARIVRKILVGDDTAIAAPNCQAMFFFNQDPADRQTFRFMDMSIGEVHSWLWDFGDGQASAESNPIHHYEQAGVYVVRLTIRGDYCSSATEMIVYTSENVTYDNNCQALFLPFLEADTNAVFFLNLSTPEATYSWDFGDGTHSDRYHVLHTYEEAGAYEVQLTITTPDSCISHFTAIIDMATQDFRSTPEHFSVTGTEEPGDLEEVVLYPNPVRENVHVQFNALVNKELEWQVISLEGAVLKRNFFQTAIGENEVAIDISTLLPGMYFLRMRNQTGSRTLRFVKH